MSKAKELARELQVSEQLFSAGDFMRLTNELCDAVLSEPEPDLRGWIECKRTDIRYLSCSLRPPKI